MDAQELKFLLTMRDEASATLKQFGSTVGDLSKLVATQTAALQSLAGSMDATKGATEKSTSALKEHAEAHKEAADSAQEHEQEDLKVGRALERLAGQAKEATEALIGLWASNEMARGAVEAAEDAEGMMRAITR